MFAPPITAASFTLPSPPSLTEKKTLLSKSPPSQLIFPNEFPYEFSSAFTSPTESEDETSEDEDDFLAGFTRRLSSQRLSSPPLLPLLSTNSEVKSEVSDATLSGFKSPDGPFPQQDSLKVISAAAGQVAKLKNFDSIHPKPNPKHVPFPYQNAAVFGQYYYNWLWRPNCYCPYPPFIPPNAVKTPFAGTSLFSAPNAVKTPATGTGVFLPSYPDSRRKSAGGSVKSTNKVVQHKIEEVSGRCVSTQDSKIDHECLVTFPSLK